MPFFAAARRFPTSRRLHNGASIVVKDLQTSNTNVLVGTDLTDCDLATIAAGSPLNFAAGDPVFIFAAGRRNVGAGATLVDAAPAGWTRIASGYQPAGADVNGVAAWWKIADGTETTVDIFTAGGAGGSGRAVYHAMSLSVVGTPAVLAFGAEDNNLVPTGQIIRANFFPTPVLAFCFVSSGSADPTAPRFSRPSTQEQGGGTATSLRQQTRLVLKLFDLDAPVDIATGLADLGTGNGLLSGLISVRL